MRGARNVEGRAHRGTEGFGRTGGIEVFENERHGDFRAGQHFESDFGRDGEGSERSREAARKIVSGDVFDDAAACLKNVAPAGDGLDP
jgi:hypothetical protein